METRPTEWPVIPEPITELYQAAGNRKNGAAEIKAIIEKHIINVSQIKDPQYNPVNAAAMTGSISTLKYLIEECRPNLDANGGDNLFVLALTQPHHLIYLADPKLKIYQKFNDGTNDLSAAVVRGDIDFIGKAIPINHKPINLQSKEQPFLTRLFYWAGICGRYRLPQFLFKFSVFQNKSMEKYFQRSLAEGAYKRGELFLQAPFKESVAFADFAFSHALSFLIDIKGDLPEDVEKISEIKRKLALLKPKQKIEKKKAEQNAPGLTVLPEQATILDEDKKDQPLPVSSSALSLQRLSLEIEDAGDSVTYYENPWRSPSPVRPSLSAVGSISSTQSRIESSPSPTTATSAKGSKIKSPLLRRAVSSQKFATATPTHFASQSSGYTQLDKPPQPKHKRGPYSLTEFFHFPTAEVEGVENLIGTTLGSLNLVPEPTPDEKAEHSPTSSQFKKMG
jgi:hypothetical protein